MGMDFFKAAQDAMKAAGDAAGQRYETAQAGKRMLDEGGPDLEQKVSTKAHCRRTVNADTEPRRCMTLNSKRTLPNPV